VKVPQPFLPIVEVTVMNQTGSTAVLQIPPQNIMSADVTIEGKTTGANLDLILFDRKFTEMEALFLSSVGKTILYRWGYSGPKTKTVSKPGMSDWYTGTLDHVTPQYAEGGVTLNIFVKGSVLTDGHMEKETRDYIWTDKGTGKKENMTPEQIVRWICQKHGWKLDMKADEVPQVIITDDTHDSSMPGPKKYSQKGQTDLEFLIELAKDQVSVTGQANYTVDFDCATNTLSFRPERFANGVIRVFYINYMEDLRNVNTEVISFTPEVNMFTVGKMGGIESALPCYDVITKQFSEKIVNNFNTPEKLLLGTWVPIPQSKNEEGSTPMKKANDTRRDQADSEQKLKSFWQSLAARVASATLVIQGDHKMAQGANVLVYFYTPSYREVKDGKHSYNRQLLYLSGKYTITKVVHHLSPGSYTTELSLGTNGFLQPPPNSNLFQKVPGTQTSIDKAASGMEQQQITNALNAPPSGAPDYSGA
jgi:hypothetical protein